MMGKVARLTHLNSPERRMPMPLIAANLNEVPDEILPISPGIHLFRVDELPSIIPTKKDPMKNNIVIVFTCHEGDSQGRKIRDYIFIGNEEDPNEMGMITLKKAAKAFGVPFHVEGIDTDGFLGQTGKIAISNGVYTDQSTGMSRPTANINAYVSPD